MAKWSSYFFIYIFYLPIPLNGFAAIVMAAAVVRQPYRPAIGISILRLGCRAVTLWQPKTKITVFYKTDPIPILLDYVGYIGQCGSFPSNYG